MTDWIDTAKALVGTHEGAGTADNQTIIGWAKKLGGWEGSYYQHDDIPWCGLFVAHCLNENGIKPPKGFLAAKSYAEWGTEIKPTPGAVLVFGRQGGGHVGFYVAEDDSAYHVLGGNQSDQVCISRIAKERLISARWPDGVSKPFWAGAKIVSSHAPLSVNEA